MIDPTASPSRLSLTSGITVQHDHCMVYSISFLLSLHPIRTAERLLLLLLLVLYTAAHHIKWGDRLFRVQMSAFCNRVRVSTSTLMTRTCSPRSRTYAQITDVSAAHECTYARTCGTDNGKRKNDLIGHLVISLSSSHHLHL